uniref:ferredoxin--NADP(+) reductase n=1 Tax=Polykrikos lebourae TaxID=370573 RepID=A0A0K0TN10_9DINO|nr:chloroplast ferredoxin-NADP+ reductase [Polykrikos lebourae]
MHRLGMAKCVAALAAIAGAALLVCGSGSASTDGFVVISLPNKATPRTELGNAGVRFAGAQPSSSHGSLFAIASFAISAALVSAVTRRAATKAPAGTRVVEGRSIPWNMWSVKAPLPADVVENTGNAITLTTQTGDANWETCHITFNHRGEYSYVEGQSLGIIAPGPDKKGESPAKIRLYSIASSATGDDETSKTVSLCVKRVVEVDGKHANREVGEDKPDKAGTHFPDKKVYRGVASNHICDARPGDTVQITGPTGAEMLLPEIDDPNIVMLATGTGIAPMRSYLRYLFHDKAGAVGGERKFKGLAWLFLGVPYKASLLYDAEHQDYVKRFPDQFRFDYAVSREDKNAAGQKMYIQTKMAEYGEELWELLKSPKTHFYLCGLKGMEAGMAEVFGPIAEKNGIVWADYFKQLKKEHRMHVEVY